MTKHKHSEMIKAKADNMELVVFAKHNNIQIWNELNNNNGDIAFLKEFDYFLCLPQHKETCLHWLNGGDVQALDSNWINVHPVEYYPWEDEHDFMCEDVKIRIKPKKEKRWIAVHKSGATTDAFLIKKEVEHSPFVEQDPSKWQFIEIEIEV